MWLQKNQSHVERKTSVNTLTAVAIDKDKNSQNALKWTIDNLLHRGQPVVLIHVKLKSTSNSSSPPLPNNPSKYLSMNRDVSWVCRDPDPQTKEIFLPFRCFLTRKDIHCKDVVLEDTDVAKTLIEYAAQTAIENLVIGASSKGGFLRFKSTDIPSTVSKGAPDFCNVYVINKGKIQSSRSALRPAPVVSPLRNELYNECSKAEAKVKKHHIQPAHIVKGKDRKQEKPEEMQTKSFQQELMSPTSSEQDIDYIRSPFTRKCPIGKAYGEISLPNADISFVSSGRASVDRLFHSFYDCVDVEKTTPQRMSDSTYADTDYNYSFESMNAGRRSIDINSDYSAFSQESARISTHSQSSEDVEIEMRRLKLELKQTMEMYSTACKEALAAKQKAEELHKWKMEEQRRLEDARLAEEAALEFAEKEKVKSRAAIEAAEEAKKIADLEARVTAGMKGNKESENRGRAIDVFIRSDCRYRKYSIEEIEEATDYFATSRKIGEGGYGPVYKSHLDHTPVAIKVLRPDADHGRQQFQQEVEVLSCIRHPNMVLLLGACPEYGCLVYEFMENGSLEDRLFCCENTKPLSWQTRFKIAAEIGTGLLFLHQTKPEPLVHRDLKPANILLDCNYVSKISDVGLARLVPPSVADTVTQYHMTTTAGTFCYIDPEYQQTGMLGVKSDIYSLGIMFLQLITARPAMGLTYHVDKAIEKGTFTQILDPAVTDWPVEQALSFAKLSLKCAELRRKDRPDLGKVIVPELIKLRAFAEDSTDFPVEDGDSSPTCYYSRVSVNLEAKQNQDLLF